MAGFLFGPTKNRAPLKCMRFKHCHGDDRSAGREVGSARTHKVRLYTKQPSGLGSGIRPSVPDRSAIFLRSFFAKHAYELQNVTAAYLLIIIRVYNNNNSNNNKTTTMDETEEKSSRAPNRRGGRGWWTSKERGKKCTRTAKTTRRNGSGKA